MKSKYHWINENILIDFELPTLLKNTIKEAEEADITNNVSEYEALSDIIDVICKGYCATGHMTHEQWNIVCQKYGYQ